MYACCPSCRTIFDVDDDILNARVGMVRCGICRVAFNACWNLVDQLPAVELPPSAVVSRPVRTEAAGAVTSTAHGVHVAAQGEPTPNGPAPDVELAAGPEVPATAAGPEPEASPAVVEMEPDVELAAGLEVPATAAGPEPEASPAVVEMEPHVELAAGLEVPATAPGPEPEASPAVVEMEPDVELAAGLEVPATAPGPEPVESPVEIDVESAPPMTVQEAEPDMPPAALGQEPVASSASADSDNVAAQALAATEALGDVGGAIELESASLLEEVERLDNALLRKQGSPRGNDTARITDIDSALKQYGDDIIPDDEIVLETPVDTWRQLDTDAPGQPSAGANERITASVDQMRAMLDPVDRPEPESEQQSESETAVLTSDAENLDPAHDALLSELDRLDGGSAGVAADGDQQPSSSELISATGADTAAGEGGKWATAWRTAAWAVGIVSMLLVMLWQVREFYLFDLAQNPAIRPVLSEFCQIATCEVPPRRDSRRIDIVGTNVETHPDVPGALRVIVSLVNRAEYSQSPPLLEVTLSDKAGRVVGRRSYTPSDYATYDANAILKPNVISNVTIDLATPSESAVGYEIQLIPD